MIKWQALKIEKAFTNFVTIYQMKVYLHSRKNLLCRVLSLRRIKDSNKKYIRYYNEKITKNKLVSYDIDIVF